ncbi:MAG: LacI family DNA-binding transcriptional regulator [Candidatus Omnitrophota bacterium]
MTTLKEIAEKTGVSTATVSKALNGKEDVSSVTRRKIKKAAEELGYLPNSIARSLVNKKTNALGLVTPYLENPTTYQRLKGIQDACLQNNYILISCLHEGNPKEEREQINALISRKVDGLILTPFGSDSNLLKMVTQSQIPFVLMSEMADGISCDFVGEDDFEGGRMATEYLISLGHKNIAYFGNSSQLYSDRQLLGGYQSGLKNHGIEFKEELVNWGNTTTQTLKDNLEKLISLQNKPTAIVAWNDLLAINILKSLEEKGLKVPEDMSIVGYDNIDFLSLFHIPLTTISQPNYEIGRKSAEILLERIKRGEDGPVQKVIFKPELVVRKSTSPPH